MHRRVMQNFESMTDRRIGQNIKSNIWNINATCKRSAKWLSISNMKLKLVKKVDEAEGTKSFFWDVEKKISYKPGQFIYLTLPKLNYPDDKGQTRHFTLSSSPTEKLLKITTRIRQESGFKKTLAELAPGSDVEAEGPEGEFVLNEQASNLQVFLAGGIGITPFRSMIKYVFDKHLSIPIQLIYSNSIPEQITFKNELDSIAYESQNIKVDHTITKPEESKVPWKGITGRIDESLIQKLITDNWQLTTVSFWLCGPPAMVEGVISVLSNLQIPLKNVRFEKFTGY